MRPISTAAQIRALDDRCIRGLGLPGPVLMENAGRLATRALERHFPERIPRGVLILCGRGNNGGDGYVIARHLHVAGARVRIASIGEPTTPDAALNRKICLRLGIPVAEALDLEGCGVVVDALLGTGLTSAPRGRVAEWIARVEEARPPLLAVDVPSGLDADSGATPGPAVHATLTVTFGRLKVGFFMEPGADRVGRLVLCDIGLGAAETWPNPQGLDAIGATLHLLEAADVLPLLPRRRPNGHKGDSGHLAILAGSADKAGAAILVANAAIRCGAGLVTLFVPTEARPRLGGLRPEIMLQEPRAFEPDAFDAVAIGPGLGFDGPPAELARSLWRSLPIPAVFDADALTALVGCFEPAPAPRLITPHAGEAGRLLGCTAAAIQADRLGSLRQLSAVAPTLLKGRHTLISSPLPRVNPTGGPQLSTAGSGDVLTGICGALLARGLTPEDAASLGAFVHGWAGELAGPDFVVAGDLVERLPEAFRTLHRRADRIESL
jgi:NAD(P)H-hydrate epimerase